MSVMLDVAEIAAQDYSPEYGTVKTVHISGDSVEITFVNDTVRNLTKGTELEIEQGGRFNKHRPVRIIDKFRK